MQEETKAIIIPGRPISKKNNMKIIRIGKRLSLVQSDAYRAYEEESVKFLRLTCKRRFEGEVHVKCLYWMPDNKSRPDLTNLIAASHDILEKAGIIDNDRNVKSLDGSRIMGIDKANPRVEIYVEKFVNHA